MIELESSLFPKTTQFSNFCKMKEAYIKGKKGRVSWDFGRVFSGWETMETSRFEVNVGVVLID